MLQTLKDYWEEFSLLPNPVKMFICAALLIVGGYGIYSGVNNYFIARKVEKLEKQKFELNRQANDALEKARKAEENAAAEAMRATEAEQKLKTLEDSIKKTDEKLEKQTAKSTVLTDNLRRVRVSRPANVGTRELEGRLEKRYGQTNRSQ